MNHSTPTRTIETDKKGLGAGKNVCHAFRTISISMELFAKDRRHPGAPAKIHVIRELSFFGSKTFFSTFSPIGSEDFEETGGKMGL